MPVRISPLTPGSLRSSLYRIDRIAKKACDQARPACERCIRRRIVCSGYRDLGDLIFKHQTADVRRRASAPASTVAGSSSALSTPRFSTPETESIAKSFFFDQFVTPNKFAYLRGTSPDDFLLTPMMACAVEAKANRENDDKGRELARRYYVEALTATNIALRHPRRCKVDNTLIAVCLLSTFEVSIHRPDCQPF